VTLSSGCSRARRTSPWNSARSKPGADSTSSVASMDSSSAGLMSTAAGTPLRVTITRSCVPSTEGPSTSNSTPAASVGAVRFTADVPDTTASFADLVLDRLAAADLDTAAQDLVLAAVQGQSELDDAVEAIAGSAARHPAIAPRSQPIGTRAEGVFLRSITVTGFRGIGSRAVLDLAAGPGLTVIAGRNGSGKSSFAEAAELALTAGVGRWDSAARAVRGGWRNLHETTTEVAVELAVAGIDRPTTVCRTWTPDAALADSTATSQVTGRPRTDLDVLGWAADLATHRPFLSPAELSTLADDRPSAMFDAVHKILGLADLAAAGDRLKQAVKDVGDQAAVARTELPQLRAALARSTDPRAAQADALVARRRADLDAVTALATGTSTGTAVDPDGVGLGILADLGGPSLGAADCADRLRAAADGFDAVAGTPAADARRLAELLDAALDHLARHGDGPCPVCGTGSLDAAWRVGATAERDRLTELAHDADAATRAVREAVSDAHVQIRPVPAALMGAPPGGIGLDAAAAAWSRWAVLAGQDDPRLLADGIDSCLLPVVDAVTAVRAAAVARRRQRDTGWRDLAEVVATWVNAARTARHLDPAHASLKAAAAWLRATGDQLRDDRLRPFAAESSRIWSQLRQQSSVELGAVRLTGAATSRKLTLDVRVDGVDGAALGVMSQGEFNALGLALFLPRATASASPFRFVVLDDPVQAMDPAKVDGLARVLTGLAATHQVVVFSHDDRLPESLRRLQLAATVLEVIRSTRSRVTVRRLSDPVAAHLDDARSLERSADLPADLRGAAVAACCRSAVEAACLEVVRRTRIGCGVPHGDVDRAWADARTTNQRFALAFFDDPLRGGEVLSRLARAGPWATACYQKVRANVHVGGETTQLVADTERLVVEIRRR